MTPESRTELLIIVNAAITDNEVSVVANSIMDANLGRPDGWIVTDDNLHLFRQYRNSVSANPNDLIREATEVTT